jgi:DNA-binding NtrC family response regulator
VTRAQPAALEPAAATTRVAELHALLVEYERASEVWHEQVSEMLQGFDALERQRRAILAGAIASAMGATAVDVTPERGPLPNLPVLLAACERNLLRWALSTTRGNQKEAAALLGIRGTTLHEKMKRLGLGRRRDECGAVRRGHDREAST